MLLVVNLLPLSYWLLVYDYSGKLEPFSQPIRCNFETKHDLVTCVFLRAVYLLSLSRGLLVYDWPKKLRLSLNQSGANFPALWAHYLLSLSLRLLVMSSWMFFLFSAQYIHRSLRWQRKTKIIHGSPANERKRAKKLIRRGIRKVSNPKFLFNWCLTCVEFSCTWAVRRFCLGHTQLKHWSRNVMSK